MHHYEVVFLVHPDQSNQILAMIDNYRSMIEKAAGQIHRLEDWGSRQLAYQINKTRKAHYVLMNIECTKETLNDLRTAFRFNDAIIRTLELSQKQAITEPSALFKSKTSEEQKKSVSSTAEDSLPVANDGAAVMDDQVLLEDDALEDDAKETDLLDINDTTLSMAEDDAQPESQPESENQPQPAAVPVLRVVDPEDN